MTTFDKILMLLKKQDKTQKQLMDYLGLGKTAFTSWRNGKNTSYKKHIDKIAEFFNVSTDYLLGKTENILSTIDVSALDEEIIKQLCQLSETELAQVDAFIKGLLSNRKN